MRRSALLLLAVLAAGCARGRTAVDSRPAGQTTTGAAAHGAEPAPSASLSPAGTEMLEQDCLACHSDGLVRQQRLTPAQWAKSLDKMRKWGAPIEQEEIEPLTGQLAAAYGLHAGPYRPTSLTAGQAAALFAPLPDGSFARGDRSRGRTVYVDHCEPCHGGDARGGDMGTGLAGRHVLDRAPELAATVRKGRGRMPDWAEATDAEIGDLLAYLRSLPGR